MKFSEIKNKPSAELKELLAAKRDEERLLRFQASEKQVKNVRSLRVVRRDISRLLTLLQTLTRTTN